VGADRRVECEDTADPCRYYTDAVTHGQTRQCRPGDQDCPAKVDCVGSFGGWSDCTAECEGGTQTRAYTVSRAAAHGGNSCPHSDGETEAESCNTQSCPVDCAGSWSEYGSCSATCGGGTQTRAYTVRRAAAHGGNSCPHSDGETEAESCNTQSCSDQDEDEQVAADAWDDVMGCMVDRLPEDAPMDDLCSIDTPNCPDGLENMKLQELHTLAQNLGIDADALVVAEADGETGIVDLINATAVDVICALVQGRDA
jgi:hypothetical protein